MREKIRLTTLKNCLAFPNPKDYNSLHGMTNEQRNPTNPKPAHKGKMMAATKTPNYTAEQTAEILAIAAENGGKITSQIAEGLAVKFGKTLRSLVAKASREGVYQAKEYTTKKGEAVQKKDSMADAIGSILRLSEAETDSLAKANKTALAKIFAALANSKPI